MNTEIKVPTVGESVTEVTIAQWLKKDGEQVEMDDVLCELESDKATFELVAEKAGILHIKAKEGETIEIGAVIAEIKPDGEDKKVQKKKKVSDEDTDNEIAGPVGRKTGAVIEMKVPSVGESITEVTIGTWSKKDGDLVEQDEVLVEIESEKATFELTAEAPGVLTIVAKEGETLGVGAVICKIEVTEGTGPAIEGGETDEAEGGETETAEMEDEKESYAANHASPAAAKILAEKGIDPGKITGTGVDGRITKEDALKALTPAQQEKPKVKDALPDTTQKLRQPDRNQRREKMSTLRKTIARRLVSVKNEMAMLTTFNEVDMKPVMDLRSKYKEQFKEKYQVNLGFMSFFVKASCQALLEWPSVNAMIDGEEIVYNDFCDISVAVSTPRGLVVPVIRDAEKLSFDQIEKEINRLAARAREGKISIDEMSGGTFTITNGGVFGSMLSTPIINAPQAAILGMHNIVERPVVTDGQIVVRPIMYVAISYDHRIIDGREAVSFLVRIKELLEDPSRLLLGI
jgi:2-oxoglutarate dehydrogenase E2 component (dihydrolipoamide succinyltransferase)